MRELQELASSLLADGTVSVVIGWEEDRHGVRPTFVTRAEDAGRLVFDHRCVHNLATYLNPRRTDVTRLGKPAVVVKGCDGKAVAGLIRETQLAREDVVVIGVRCGGVLAKPTSHVDLSDTTLAPRCARCDCHEPHRADHVIGPAVAEASPQPPPVDRLRQIEAMPAADRWAFWTQELGRCIRCHACRDVCPLCFCERCVADKTQPQWIDSSPHGRGNLAWHLTRALHLAGRCVGCGECQRACPVEIPLGLLNCKVAEVVASRFGHRASDDPSVPAPIGTYQMNDAQEFIL